MRRRWVEDQRARDLREVRADLRTSRSIAADDRLSPYVRGLARALVVVLCGMEADLSDRTKDPYL